METNTEICVEYDSHRKTLLNDVHGKLTVKQFCLLAIRKACNLTNPYSNKIKQQV